MIESPAATISAGLRPPPRDVQDCPECRSTGSVRRDVCEICYAEFGERLDGGAADLPPAAAPLAAILPAPLRFSDVVAELHAIAGLASAADAVAGVRVAQACRRAEMLLRSLRSQFLSDVGAAVTGASGADGPAERSPSVHLRARVP